MIVICGTDDGDGPLATVTAALDRLDLPYTVLQQRRFQDTLLDIEVDGTAVHGRLLHHDRSVDCSSVTGVYARLMDWRTAPEAAGGEDEATSQDRRRWNEVLRSWIEIAPGCVMNRAAASATNGSKPYQAQLIGQAGFRVPETLVTNDLDLVHDFRHRHGPLIYKSISAARSQVRLLDDEAIGRLPLIRDCPVQFQRYVPGTNLRVHAVAGELFATRVDTDRVDYRFARREGGRTELSPWQLPDELAQRCLTLVSRLGLTLAGIDLLLADDGGTYCFEVNPSPAFGYYEHYTGQPIARAVALALQLGRDAA